ncbi:MAG: DNA/RNA nuclease SfsA [Desulfobacterales bacterium]|jgi:sugar fermentation stimulation protein A
MNKMTNPGTQGALSWPRLLPGTLVKRYQRFLADVRLDGDGVVTAHCPNTGSMKGCCQPGRPVFLSTHNNPKRKLKYTWELIQMPESLVGVNTLVPNRLVAESIGAGLIEELNGYDHMFREARVGHSRIDLLLEKANGKRCFVEIKNSTLVAGGVAYFPDAVTSRGLKHLQELRQLIYDGHRCVMFYFIQRMDAREFSPADHIDPQYGKALRKAVQKGVEVLAYDVDIDLKRIKLRNNIPCRL